MSKATYWQRGESLDFVNAESTVIEANTIMDLGTRIGVVGTDVNPGEKGSIHVTGVYEIQKTGTGKIEMGAAVYYDGTGITTTESGTPAGYAAAAAEADAEVILVKLLG